MRFEVLQPGGNDFREVRLLVALGNADRFVDLSITQRSSYLWRKCPRLFARGIESDVAIDHDADRPRRHDEQDDDDDTGQPAHLLPQRNGIPANFRVSLQPHGQNRQLVVRHHCESCQ